MVSQNLPSWGGICYSVYILVYSCHLTILLLTLILYVQLFLLFKYPYPSFISCGLFNERMIMVNVSNVNPMSTICQYNNHGVQLLLPDSANTTIVNIHHFASLSTQDAGEMPWDQSKARNSLQMDIWKMWHCGIFVWKNLACFNKFKNTGDC